MITPELLLALTTALMKAPAGELCSGPVRAETFWPAMWLNAWQL
jgi:hypothetical protein